MVFSLKDSWAKVDRAAFHLSEVYRSFDGFIDGDLLDIPILNKADHQRGCISVAVKELPVDSIGVGLVLGDAIHNYRSCLDYLWWQIATLHIGDEPTIQQAPKIQFPILSNENDWGSQRYFKFVPLDKVYFIKKYQPFAQGVEGCSALEGLREISNHDKHRNLYPVIAKARSSNFINSSDRGMTPVAFDLPDVIDVGTEVIRFKVDLEGLDVKYAITGSFKAYLAVQNNWNILELLTAVDKQCRAMLKEAEFMFRRN
ncbi:hypothetical protein POF45_00865 [Pseudomonas sp. 681]|uniref:TIGR04255 family protein n=1 Tax=Pseudomonas fungipugnans TaxID=3024217 RepID=A0ABT6QGH1_9PSED|nr:hypothetical protein [Pseudomonas sp. 681]MDI2589983.1 hypothetical protein [Pseudomonas sp. 681]